MRKLLHPENESGTAVATPPAQAGKKRGPKEKSPSALEFAKAWNDPSVKTRQDVIKLLEKRGFEMSYSALVNRAKSYTDDKRQGGPIQLKELEAGQRGRRVDSAAINAELAQMATAQVATTPNEGSETK